MYRRSKFLEVLLDIRQEMAAESDHEVDQFVQNLWRETASDRKTQHSKTPLNGSEITKAAVKVRTR